MRELGFAGAAFSASIGRSTNMRPVMASELARRYETVIFGIGIELHYEDRA